MARYIKVNPKVAKHLHLENDRLQVKDGNYILWQGDMTAFGPLPMLSEALTQIGGIALMPYEAKEEQDGINNRPLPVATDERFIIEPETEQPISQTDEAEGEAPTPASEEAQTDTTDSQPEDEGNGEAESEQQADQTDADTDSQPKEKAEGESEETDNNTDKSK